VEALVYENSGLAWAMIARQLSGNAEYADLYQEARLGLWRAILYFDTSHGIASRRSHALQSGGASDRQCNVHGKRKAGWRQIAQEIVWQALGEELDALPERCRRVIELHYGLTGEEPQTLAKIGRAWKLS
jgi:DNA-directed RNA polymerase sigma subunit (sigma70/sigma32)